MGTETSRVIRHFFGIAFAAFVLAITPLPLAADIATFSGSASFDEADSAYIDFTVNPDGSVTTTQQGLFGGSWDIPCNSPACPQLQLPSFLPEGIVVNSATLSFSIQLNPYTQAVSQNCDYFSPSAEEYLSCFEVEGSGVLNYVTLSGCGSGSWGTQPGVGFPPDTFDATPVVSPVSFMSCSTPGAVYYPGFYGSDNFTLQAVAPPYNNFGGPEGNNYYVAINVDAVANYSITVNYTPPVPEPRTYTFLVGLAMAALFVIRSRRRA